MSTLSGGNVAKQHQMLVCMMALGIKKRKRVKAEEECRSEFGE